MKLSGKIFTEQRNGGKKFTKKVKNFLEERRKGEILENVMRGKHWTGKNIYNIEYIESLRFKLLDILKLCYVCR